MFKMGKFDRRGRGPDYSSFDNCLSLTSSSKVGFKPKKHVKHTPYFGDPQLIPRINQYLADNKDKVYVDINDMVNDLQTRYKDYGRRKRNAFKALVEKAFAVVLEQCGMGQGLGQVDPNYVESTENSSSEVEECNIVDNEDSSITSSNNQLLNLYKSSQLHYEQFQQSNASAELIDLSSDDENSKKKDESGEKDETAATAMVPTTAAAAGTVSTNGLQNHVFSRETSLCLVPSNTPKPGTPGLRLSVGKAAERERPYVTIVRKRKSANQGDKILHSAKKKKDSVPKEPRVTFASFGGNRKALEEVCKLILHVQYPELYKQIGVSSPRGFLLHGPPGCGKTLLATAIAGELDVPLIKVAAPELVGGLSGESEERIRELFDKAVESAPCVLFIDEVDAVTPNRQNAQREMERRIVAQLLACLDDLSNKPNGDQVLVVGATNRPDSLDPALRRAGRFDREVCLGIPDQKAREQILQVLCKNLKLTSNFSFEDLAQNTPGYVGADLLALTREAAMAAINRAFGALQQTDKNKIKKKRKKETVPIVPEKQEVANKVSSLSENKNPEDAMEIDVIDDVKKKPEESPAPEVKKEATPEKSGDNEVQNVENKEKKEDEKVEVKKEKEKPAESEEKKEEKKEEEKKEEKKEEEKENEKKADSDMDIAETVSEESVNCEGKEVEVCNEKTAASDESDIEILPESCDSSPPTLETLLMWIRSAPPLTQRQLKNLYITQEDFNKALKCVQPSAKREGFATVPDVTWDDVGSLADIREELKMSILGPVKYRKQFEQVGLTAPAGILICGPPGCGKTLLAKAVANEAGINFISVKGPELLNMYVGESERAVRQCFQRARNSAPCVIFFDELDALCPRRSDSGENGASMRVVNQMLTEMDGIEDRKEVYLMAATNRPDIVDPAVLRPGRLDKILYVGLPEANDRVDILRALTKNGTKPKLAENVDLNDIGNKQECNGYSGADLAALVREAGVQALKDLVNNKDADLNGDIFVTLEHFERALKNIRPSVSELDKKHYESLRKRFTLAPHK